MLSIRLSMILILYKKHYNTFYFYLRLYVLNDRLEFYVFKSVFEA